MTNLSRITDKIKKCLALAEDEGATTHEAEVALAFAHKLAAKHAIDMAKLMGVDGTLKEGTVLFELARRHHRLIPAERLLIVLRHMYPVEVFTQREWMTKDYVYKVAAPAEFEAAIRMTYDFIYKQVEDQMIAALPDDCKRNKGKRHKFAQEFEWACYSVLIQRARDIAERMRTDDEFAQQQTGSNALVVAESRDALMKQVEKDLFSEFGIKLKTAIKKGKYGQGSRAGGKAAENVNLQASL